MRPRNRNKNDSPRSPYSGSRRGAKNNSSNFNGKNKDEISRQRRVSQLSRREKSQEDSSKQSYIDTENKARSSRSKRGSRNFEKSPKKERLYREVSYNSLKRTDAKSSNGSISSKSRFSEEGLPRKNSSINNQDHFEEDTHEKDIFWGRHATQAILESGRPLHRIWCTSELRSSQRFLQLLRDAKSLGVLVEEVSWARLGHLTNAGVHQGIALQTSASETFDLKTLIEGCSTLDEHPVLLALDGLTDPHNLGAIVRSAEAFGAHGLVLPQRRSAGLTGSVAKVAAGALEHLPVARVVNLNRSLEALKKVGYTIIGLAQEGSETLNQLHIDGPLVVVIGSEGKGVSLLTRKHCDQLIRIPLRGVTTSLNASVATSIFLYEVANKTWMRGISGNAPSPKLVRAKLSKII